MSKFSAVVYTAGRTGSHLIINNLCKKVNTCRRSDQDFGFTDGVVHTHDPLYKPPTEDFIAIVSQRKNLFESVLSTELAKVTNEFTSYTNKHITPYIIDTQKFKECLRHQKMFYQVIDRTKFKQVVDVYYEDLLSDPYCLMKDFGIVVDVSKGKSPYNYYNLIINVNELIEVYHQSEREIFSQQDLDHFRQTIEANLQDIRVNFNGNRP